VILLGKTLNIIITGVGGQGNILVSRLISTVAIRSGLHVRGVETLGAAQRGGHVVSHLRIGESIYSPRIPPNRADILVALEPVEGLRLAGFLTEDSVAIVNSKTIPPADVKVGNENYPDMESVQEAYDRLTKTTYLFNATELAIKAGSPVAANVVLLGALAATETLPMSTDTIKEVLVELVPKGTEDMNVRAFDLGYEQIGSRCSQIQS
jgi:indolepyruvate ferredoxin oxidoreductase beta subunit